MKKIITLIFSLVIIISSNSFAQLSKPFELMNESERAAAKLEMIKNKPNPTTPSYSQRTQSPNAVNATGAGCNCWIDRDASWNIAPFTNGSAPEYRNDDGSTTVIALPFNFCFYGRMVDSVFINNNGNVSIDFPYWTYSADSFPSSAFTMIAPFWSDVDTQDPASGLVYYQITATHMIVQWEEVGYYSSHSDLKNTFQLIMTDGVDNLLPPNSNVSFCYKEMEWACGDITGTGGFGGPNPGTVGINQGNGTDYIQIGRFDSPGGVFDGPYGNADGIDFLDNQNFILNACISSPGMPNVPPIMMSTHTCDTLTVCENDTLLITGTFLSPEVNQITSCTVASLMTGLSVIQNNPGNTVDWIVQIIGLSSNLGMNRFDLIGTDNGTPVRSIRMPIVVNVINEPTASYTYSPTGTIGVGIPITFSTVSGDTLHGVTYSWDFGDGTPISNDRDPIHSYATGGTYFPLLTVTNPGGCSITYSLQIDVYNCALAAMSVSNACLGAVSTITFTGVSLPSANYTWNFTGATVLSGSGAGPYTVQWNSPGTYAVDLTISSTGCSASSASQNVTIYDFPVASLTSTPSVCLGQADVIQYTGTLPGTTILTWDFAGGTGGGSGQGPFNVSWNTAGNYVVQTIADNNGCTDTVTANITVNSIPNSLFTATPSVCAGDPVTVNYTGTASAGANYAWDFNGATVSSGSGQGPYALTWNTAGAYQLSLTVTENGCSSTQTLQPVTINPIPTASIAATPSLCVGAANAISFNGSASAGATYNWGFGTGSVVSGSGVGPYSVQWNAAANEQVTLTVTDAGCSNSTTFNVNINPIPNSPFTITPSVCVGDNVTLAYTGSASSAASYVWNLDGGQSSGGSQGPFNVVWNTPGTYNVSLTVSENGCTSTQTINQVVNNAIPDAQISAMPGLCIGEQNNISFTGTADPSATYNWSFGSGTVNSGSGAGPYNVQWAAAGNETLTLTVTQNGCSDNTTYNVVVNAIPTSFFSLPPSICVGSPFNVSYTGTSGTGAGFIWDFGTATVLSGSGAGPYSVVSNTAGSPAISLVVDDNGCVSPTTIQNIIIAPIPVVVAGSDNAVCSGTVLPIGGPAEASTVYSWSPTSGIDNPAISNPNITLENNGAGTVQTTYYVTATNSYGCVNQDTVILGAHAIPNVEYPTPTAQCLDGNSFTFIPVGNTFAGINYTWDFGAASDIGTSTAKIPPAVSYNAVGFHTVTLNTTYNGCPGMPFVDQIEVLEMPVAAFLPEVTEGCAPLLVPFTNLSSTNSSTYQWSYSDGSGDATETPSHLFTEAGSYTVTLTSTTARGCSSTSTQLKVIEVFPVPVAAFLADPEIATIYEPIIHFQNTTVNGAIYQWSFGDSTGTAQTSPYHTYNAVGAYEIILMTESDKGCMDTTRGVIRIEYGYSFFVPSAFTPNGDGVNDYFQGYGTFIKEYELAIYDRWGTEVFRSNSYDIPWDGKVHKEVQNDIYVYKIKVNDLKNEKHTYVGKVSVIR
ncbi:MAG: PKD domain-containing protein [Bacteroidetes bacterium]|nr:PKD domain-containing protein [Bacteroidota bacterium]